MTLVRLVPVAPFAVVGVVAGAVRVSALDYLLGTVLGMLPGTLAATVFGDQLQALLRDPGRIDYALVAGAALVMVALAAAGRCWLARFFR
jgi:uncharacterized membrane protein YdjX (TVP38/TMEM64 family)